MADLFYPSIMDALAQKQVDLINEAVYAFLIDTAAFSYNAAHSTVANLSGVVKVSEPLTGKQISGGLFTADPAEFTNVTGALSPEAIVLAAGSSGPTGRLIIWKDTGMTGMGFTPTGGNVTFNWPVAGVFQL